MTITIGVPLTTFFFQTATRTACGPRNAAYPPPASFGSAFSNIYEGFSAASTQQTEINREIEGNFGTIGIVSRRKEDQIMRREGRQHGHVRTQYMATDSQTRGAPPRKAYRRIQPPATAGRFHRVDPGKPTNHSKFTGKCGRARCGLCHLDPVGKSKTKTKGLHKHRSRDVLTNHRMYAWRLVDDQPLWAVGRDAFSCFGESAASLISFLADASHQDYYCNSCYTDDSVLDVEELELSRDFQGKAEISEPSALSEVGGTAIESVSLFNASRSASDCSSWAVEILSKSESDDDDWCFVDEKGREEN